MVYREYHVSIESPAPGKLPIWIASFSTREAAEWNIGLWRMRHRCYEDPFTVSLVEFDPDEEVRLGIVDPENHTLDPDPESGVNLSQDHSTAHEQDLRKTKTAHEQDLRNMPF